MMYIVPYEPCHWDNFQPQAAQASMFTLVDQPTKELLSRHESYTGIIDGKVVGFCGVIEMWHGRAVAWAWLSELLEKKMIYAHRAVRKFLSLYDINRLEAIVDAKHEAGIRWIEMLGFKRETVQPMEMCLPCGGSAYLYARVRQK